MNDNDKDEKSGSTGETGSSRRRFLQKAGKLAVYTPPAMLLMAKPSLAHFQTSSGTDCTSYTKDFSSSESKDSWDSNNSWWSTWKDFFKDDWHLP